MTNVTIGSVSTGTLRIEDLLPVFADELRTLDSAAALVREYDALPDNWAEAADLETPHFMLDELQDALNEHAPPHVYFGAIEGDGADFGFWPELNFDNCTLRAGDSDDERVDDDCGIIIQASDHGNVEVYNLKRSPLWSAV